MKADWRAVLVKIQSTALKVDAVLAAAKRPTAHAVRYLDALNQTQGLIDGRERLAAFVFFGRVFARALRLHPSEFRRIRPRLWPECPVDRRWIE